MFGVCIMPAHAENPFGSSLNCARLNFSIKNESRANTSVAWKTQAESGESYSPAAYKIAVWGDSLTSSRDFINAALNSYGIRKESVLPSFIQAGFNVAGVSLPLKASCATKGWTVNYAHKESRDLPGFSKGFLSVSSETPNDAILLDFRSPQPSIRVKQLNILYHKRQSQGLLVLGVAIDGGEETLISLSKKSEANFQIRPKTPMSTIKIRLIAGQITVHGFEPVYQDEPAVILDSLSVPGGLFKSWSNVDERYFFSGPEQVLDYDLVLVQYGTNEGANFDFDLQKYLNYLRSNLSQLRKFYPKSRCVLIGPPDRGVTGRAQSFDSLKFSKAHRQISLAQKQAGLEYHCGFWDWQAAMGGAGAATRWARMNPPQMQPDLTHLTAKGYEVSGRMFATAFPLNKN